MRLRSLRLATLAAVAAPPKVVTEDTKLLEHESGADDTGLPPDVTRFVASFAPRSRVRIGDKIRVVVDTERLHFFDPATGLAVRD